MRTKGVRTINLKFTKETNRCFSLKATDTGATNGYYRMVDGLKNPNFDYWDKRKQEFCHADEDSIFNNKVLEGMKVKYQLIIDTLHPTSAKELFRLEEQASKVAAKGKFTFGLYLEKLITDSKSGAYGIPSSTYYAYVTFLNKLKEEGNIIDIAISEITDKEFEDFGNWLIATKSKSYSTYMLRFKTVITKARNEKFTTHVLSYMYDKKIKKTREDNNVTVSRHALSVEDWNRYINLDISKVVRWKTPDSIKRYELYRDLHILMYELKMRPIDVIKLRKEEIKNGKVWYTPEKLKNKATKKTVTPITLLAQKVLNKYVGSCEYWVLPFELNNRDWDLSDPKEYHEWQTKERALTVNINNYCLMVARYMNIPVFVNYDIRHTTFTHKIAEGMNIMQLAKEGGTSIAMLEKTYYDFVNLIA